MGEENARLMAMYQAQVSMMSRNQDLLGSAPSSWKASTNHKRQGSTGTASTTTADSQDGSDIDTLSCDDDAISIASDDSDEPPATMRTTMIVQNIPNRYTRTMLVELFDAQGFQGSYNMVYLPTDFSTAVSFGYAFVNFETPESAGKFASAFQGFSDWTCKSDKVCVVDCAAQQGGLDGLIS